MPVEKVSRETVDIKCAHGDVVSYPLAEVSMRVGDHPVKVQAAVSDRLPVPVLVGREVSGFNKLLGATLCGGSTEATKEIAIQSQRGQEKLSEHEWEDLERESWGALSLSQGQRQVHGEMSHWASASPLCRRECRQDSRSGSGATLSCRRRRGEECEVVMPPSMNHLIVT